VNLRFASGMSGESENSSGNYGHAGQQPGGQATVGCRCHKRQRQPDHDQRRWHQVVLAQHPSQHRLAIDLLVTPAQSVRSRERQRHWQPGDGETLNHEQNLCTHACR